MSMTQQEAQDAIHVLYEVGDTTTPSSSSDDWKVRQALLNVAISIWEKDGPWDELYLTKEGTLTLDQTSITIDALDKWQKPVGNLWINRVDGGRTRVIYVKPENIESWIDETGKPYYYVTGNEKTGKSITLVNCAAKAGDTYEVPYYAYATKLTAAGDIFEMADPFFAIYYTLYHLYKADDDEASKAESYAEAGQRLDKMTDSKEAGVFHESDRTEDTDTSGGFGG